MGNLSGVRLGVQQQQVEVVHVLNQKSLVARWRHASGLLVGTITDGWLSNVASESSSDNRVNTLLFSPVLGHSVVSVRVVTLELLGVLLHDFWVRQGASHLVSMMLF